MKTIKETVKSLLETIVDFLDSVGRARVATELARHGRHAEANELINGKKFQAQ